MNARPLLGLALLALLSAVGVAAGWRELALYLLVGLGVLVPGAFAFVLLLRQSRAGIPTLPTRSP